MSTLHVMVASYSRLARDSFNGESGSGRIIMPLIDARMDEFNCGCYKVNDLGFVSPMTTDQLLSRSNALALIDEHKPEVIIGEGHMLFLDEMENYTRLAAIYPDAQDLLYLAVERFQRGMAVPVDSVDLVYLRGTGAWQKRKRLRDSL